MDFKNIQMDFSTSLLNASHRFNQFQRASDRANYSSTGSRQRKESSAVSRAIKSQQTKINQLQNEKQQLQDQLKLMRLRYEQSFNELRGQLQKISQSRHSLERKIRELDQLNSALRKSNQQLKQSCDNQQGKSLSLKKQIQEVQRGSLKLALTANQCIQREHQNQIEQLQKQNISLLSRLQVQQSKNSGEVHDQLSHIGQLQQQIILLTQFKQQLQTLNSKLTKRVKSLQRSLQAQQKESKGQRQQVLHFLSIISQLQTKIVKSNTAFNIVKPFLNKIRKTQIRTARSHSNDRNSSLNRALELSIRQGATPALQTSALSDKSSLVLSKAKAVLTSSRKNNSQQKISQPEVLLQQQIRKAENLLDRCKSQYDLTLRKMQSCSGKQRSSYRRRLNQLALQIQNHKQTLRALRTHHNQVKLLF